LVFRLTQPSDVIVLETPLQVIPDASYKVTQEGNRTVIESLLHAKVNDKLTVRLVSTKEKELNNH
jgi:beta-galactosidase